MSLVPETWATLSRGSTPQGEPYAIVSRKKSSGHLTVWTLIKRGTGKGPRWYSTSPQYVSLGTVRNFPEKKGVRLSDSRIDRILAQLAEA